MSKPISNTEKPSVFDAIIIGGGAAAGTFCAIYAAKLRIKVAIIEQNHHIGNKIRVFGSNHCNVTNLYIDADADLSINSNFYRSALARYLQ